VDATQGSITKDASSLGPRDPPHELLRRQSTTAPLPAEAMSPHRDTMTVMMIMGCTCNLRQFAGRRKERNRMLTLQNLLRRITTAIRPTCNACCPRPPSSPSRRLLFGHLRFVDPNDSSVPRTTPAARGCGASVSSASLVGDDGGRWRWRGAPAPMPPLKKAAHLMRWWSSCSSSPCAPPKRDRATFRPKDDDEDPLLRRPGSRDSRTPPASPKRRRRCHGHGHKSSSSPPRHHRRCPTTRLEDGP